MQLKRALEAIGEARRPIICCGGGVVLAGAREEMTAFAEKSGIPIVSTMMGIGVMPMGSPVYLGMIGRYGRSYANRAIGEADLIILCGARVGDRAIALPNQIAEQARTIHIDIDPAEIGKNMRADIPIVGDVKQVLAALAEKVRPVGCQDWVERVLRYKREFVPRGQDREDFVEPPLLYPQALRHDGGGRHPHRRPGPGADLGGYQLHPAGGAVPHQRGPGHHGLRLARGLGGQAGKAPRQVLAVCGGRRLPDEPVRAGHGGGLPRAAENRGL